jgi:hypothetical protein
MKFDCLLLNDQKGSRPCSLSTDMANLRHLVLLPRNDNCAAGDSHGSDVIPQVLDFSYHHHACITTPALSLEECHPEGRRANQRHIPAVSDESRESRRLPLPQYKKWKHTCCACDIVCACSSSTLPKTDSGHRQDIENKLKKSCGVPVDPANGE